MMDQIREWIFQISSGIIILQAVLQVVPLEKYRGYMKIILILMIMAMAGSYMKQADFFRLQTIFETEFGLMQNRRHNWGSQFEKQETISLSGQMSTYYDNVKTKVNNIIMDDHLYVKMLKIDVCEDYKNVDYGKIKSISIKLEKIVDKTVNIFNKPIIIKQHIDCTDNLREKSEYTKKIRQDIAETLQVEEEVLQIEMD
ncbi:MAG: hypothetical protein GX567_09115 [Clostridia bacterium]|nr:hypothetical protein [Clostridia bacterium]